MRYFLVLLTNILYLSINGQGSLNMNLVYQWSDPSLPSSQFYDNTYNEVWGYAANGREYAIIGSTAGTHIFDITDVNAVDTVGFIPGKAQGVEIVHRDYDTYKDRLYIVSDEGNSSLQIADLSFLPDSVSLVYDSDVLISRSHNIFIDTTSGYLYTCGGYTNTGANAMSIYSLLQDPINPKFIMNCLFDLPFWNPDIGYIHDVYVKNDTAYCHAGNNGMYVIDFSDIGNVQVLGYIVNYVQSGYNHSGWLDNSGRYYAMADETWGMDVKILDVSNLAAINVIDTIGSNIDQNLSMPHNLIFKDNYLYVSHYVDGIYVFNTSDPTNISLAGYYDTSTRSHGLNMFEGNWGVYPFLPSGKILASDMQEGLFVFETSFSVGTPETKIGSEFTFLIYPNPAINQTSILTTAFEDPLSFSIKDINGREVKLGMLTKSQSNIGLTDLKDGIYLLSIQQADGKWISKKFIKK